MSRHCPPSFVNHLITRTWNFFVSANAFVKTVIVSIIILPIAIVIKIITVCVFIVRKTLFTHKFFNSILRELSCFAVYDLVTIIAPRDFYSADSIVKR